MKVFIALCALFAIASAADWAPKTKDELETLHNECLKEHKVPENLVEKIKKHEYVDDETVRCSVRCTGQKTEMWDDEKGFNVDRMIEQLSKTDAKLSKDDLKKCIDNNEAKSDKCTWAYREFKCMIDNKYLVPPTKA